MIQYPGRLVESIQKFKDAVSEPKCDAVIEGLLTKAYEMVSGVSLWEKKSQTQTATVSTGYVYYLDINNTADNKREIIYELMHEMGHVFDPVKLNELNKEESEKGREIRAWEFADKEFSSYPQLSQYELEYTEHKQKRLQTYEL